MNIKISDLCNCLFGNQIQKLENKLREFLYILKIDIVEGDQLDNIGEIVGQDRLGYSDAYYRILLKVKIGANVSEGDIERILTLWKLLSSSENVQLHEIYPGKIKLITDEYLPADIFIFMKSFASIAIAGGVGIDTIMVTDPTRFGFGATMGAFDTLWATVY